MTMSSIVHHALVALKASTVVVVAFFSVGLVSADDQADEGVHLVQGKGNHSFWGGKCDEEEMSRMTYSKACDVELLCDGSEKLSHLSLSLIPHFVML